MKTIKLKNILTLTSILVIMLFSTPMFSQIDNPEEDVNDEVLPIDQNIWTGIIVGCAIGAYFFIGKQKNALNNKG